MCNIPKKVWSGKESTVSHEIEKSPNNALTSFPDIRVVEAFQSALQLLQGSMG
jgi:hypothetical protein